MTKFLAVALRQQSKALNWRRWEKSNTETTFNEGNRGGTVGGSSNEVFDLSGREIRETVVVLCTQAQRRGWKRGGLALG